MGPWGEWLVRIVGGILLLSAANTALTDMISVQYLMARDGELPAALQGLNRFGVPWIPAVVAAAVPILVLVVSHDLENLAALYAIGVVGAVAINVSLCAFHPRLRRLRRKVPMVALGVVLLAIWITLAGVKHAALLFVVVVIVAGLGLRELTRYLARRGGPRPSLLRQAIMEQLSPEAWSKPRILLGTYGSEALAPAALQLAREQDAALVVCFIRQVSLSVKWDRPLSIDTDLAAQRTFIHFLKLGSQFKVPVIPVYDTGTDAATLLAENAAVNSATTVLIGSSRRGALFQFIKGRFQQQLEALLPPDIQVRVVSPETAG
jgi:hypothetical protein